MYEVLFSITPCPTQCTGTSVSAREALLEDAESKQLQFSTATAAKARRVASRRLSRASDARECVEGRQVLGCKKRRSVLCAFRGAFVSFDQKPKAIEAVILLLLVGPDTAVPDIDPPR
jgi:hypothetical protein